MGGDFNMKSKVIQWVVASALLGSALTAVPTFEAKAATNISASVSKAVKKAKVAQDTYINSPRVVSGSDVNIRFMIGMNYYKATKKLVEKDKSKNKEKYVKDLKKAHLYLLHAKNYIKALKYGKHMNVLGSNFNGILRIETSVYEKKARKKIRDGYADFGKEMAHAEREIRQLVYGSNAEELVVDEYLSLPKEVQPLTRAYYLSMKAEKDIANGNLASAQSRLADAKAELLRNKGKEETVSKDTRVAATEKLLEVNKTLEGAQHPAIQKIRAVNPTLIEVSFSAPMDKETVNHSVSIDNITVENTSSYVLSKDRKTLQVRVPQLKVDQNYTIRVKNVKSAVGKAVPNGEIEILFNDTEPPGPMKFKTTKDAATEMATVELTFTEDVIATEENFLVDGMVPSKVIVDKNNVTIIAQLNKNTAGHTLEIKEIEDLSGNTSSSQWSLHP